MLNLEQAKRLFEQEAVLAIDRDGVPRERMEQIFGREIVQGASGLCKRSSYSNIFGCGASGSVEYFYFGGFLLIATYANTMEVIDARRAEVED